MLYIHKIQDARKHSKTYKLNDAALDFQLSPPLLQNKLSPSTHLWLMQQGTGYRYYKKVLYIMQEFSVCICKIRGANIRTRVGPWNLSPFYFIKIHSLCIAFFQNASTCKPRETCIDTYVWHHMYIQVSLAINRMHSWKRSFKVESCKVKISFFSKRRVTFQISSPGASVPNFGHFEK